MWRRFFPCCCRRRRDDSDMSQSLTQFPQGMTSSPVRPPSNKVELAVSVLGGVPPMAAYHSSVIVNGEEFSFSDGGIYASMDRLASHSQMQGPDGQPAPKLNPQVIDMGMSQHSGHSMKMTLERHFSAGTYDLLRKNCNSFSDAAIWYLLHKRLPDSYCRLEKLGASSSLVQTIMGGQYKPNPKANDFNLEELVVSLDPEKIWSTNGQATGGAVAGSSNEMRAARLARLGPNNV
eukprot:TRINITY_DN46040_c0_g1_i1.p1 TRINITY_DN46040_c0_g1~~TRINITY_DN46040_c0_g1_i1.p1  ORF type:complete len:234 (-),score=38.54 TRINITY_DN46040_c0_g1_i1:68-769(-)